MCLDPDYDCCDVWNEREVTSRKEHKCSECRGKINKGVSYFRHFSVYDGSVNSGKICSDCHGVWMVFMEHYNGYRLGPPSLMEVLCDCIADGDEESEQIWKPAIEAMKRRDPSNLELSTHCGQTCG